MQRRQFVLLTALGAVGCEVESEPKVPTSTGELDSLEAEGLVFMRQEEKLARDVYIQLGEAHPMRVFDNISSAEQRHMDAVAALLDRHGIEDPVADLPIGSLVNEELQRLHDELVARGLQSQEEALRVGALIEEVDIADLRERDKQTDEADIHQLYADLERGSHNHLRAFVRQLDRMGVEYAPQSSPRRTTARSSATSQRLEGGLEELADLLGEGLDVGAADDLEHGDGVDGADHRIACIVTRDDDVARQEQTDAGLRLESPVGQLRIAGAEDDVVARIDVDLLLERRLDVDLREHAEALGREGGLGLLDAVGVAHTVERSGESVLGLVVGRDVAHDSSTVSVCTAGGSGLAHLMRL